jgi:hypothetical protein
MLAPVMHRVDVYTHYFFVPNRIVWDEWEDFIRGGDDGSLNPSFPRIRVDGEFANVQKGSLWDYFGLPIAPNGQPAGTDTYVNALPFRAYQSIYNNWYRDQDLQPEISIPVTTSGIHTAPGQLTIRKRNLEKDYFTSARPNAQKTNPVNYLGIGEPWLRYNTDGSKTGFNAAAGSVSVSGPGRLLDSGSAIIGPSGAYVSDLRRAEAMQSYLERLQRTGNRYREYLAGIWGVISSDARIDIPEYLGGGKSPVVMSEVLTNAETSASGTSSGTGVGEMYGHGISVSQNHGFTRSFEEHGFIIGIMSIIPKTSYSKGIERFWTRTNRFEFALPDFALIGEQAIQDREIYFDTASGGIDSASAVDTWGYQQRYAEYKYGMSRIHGDMRTTLRYWHLDRDITGTPLLNSAFVTADEGYNDYDRIFQVTEGDPFWIQLYNKVDAIRPLPYESIPDLT